MAALNKGDLNMTRRFAVVALAGAALLGATGTAEAARGGAGGGGKDTGSTTVFLLNEAAPIVHGQQITFTVSTTVSDRPMSKVECYQNGSYVYHSTRGHFQDYYDYFGEPIHYLSSVSWTSGGADCMASLIYQGSNGRMRTITSFGFSVGG